ncbi:MAG: 4Fe-4S ferredoxin, partial [Gemmatimonadota bacterium]|nr:4Fe-4S ferredoxin [Gemmatimonadota bacterium]
TTVTLSYRGEAWDRVKPRNREKLDRAIAAGKVTPLLGSTVREVRHDVVVVDVAGEATILPNDFVVIRIGGDAPFAFLERLGVRIVEKELPTGAKAG